LVPRREHKVFKTATVTEVREGLKDYIGQLPDGPIVVTAHGRPSAVLIQPEAFESFLESAELLEDLILGRQALEEYLADPNIAVDAEEVFARLGP
jgi:prevent-host-death family protein